MNTRSPGVRCFCSSCGAPVTRSRARRPRPRAEKGLTRRALDPTDRPLAATKMAAHGYTIGIEEEYFVVDLRTRNVRATMPQKFFRSSKRRLKHHVTNEMLQSQIEVTTSPCRTIAEAREQVQYVRAALAAEATRYNLG